MDKNSIRELCLERLQSASKKRTSYVIDKKISMIIDEIIKELKPRSILFYMPLKLEVNLIGIMKKYRKILKILIPKVQKESFEMVLFRLPLEENSFKILEIKNGSNAYKNVDMIIVPIISMDKNMQRVGFGKGMYDRFYHSLKHKPTVIFVQRKICISSEPICDEYDIYGDYYITSKEKIIGKKYDRYTRSRSGCRSRRRSRIFRDKGIS